MSQSQTLIGHIDKYDPEEHYIGKQSTLCPVLLGVRSEQAAETYVIRTMEEVFIGRDPDRW